MNETQPLTTQTHSGLAPLSSTPLGVFGCNPSAANTPKTNHTIFRILLCLASPVDIYCNY